MFDSPELARRAYARVGTVLAGKYRIDSVLGVGGMAVVYAATHRNQAEFAIKMLHPEYSFQEDVRSRFLREGYTANSVKHPGAVRVVDDALAEDGAAFLVMELLQGVVVEALAQRSGGRLPAQVAGAIVDQLLDVLCAAHAKGIVHRDIKPANLFLTTDGTVKVLDFGIARAREAAAGTGTGGKTTGTGVLLGTPAFMAPEQALAKSNEIDAQTDVWAAAATLFTLVTGQYVHQGDNAPQLLVSAATRPARSLATVVRDVPPAIARVVDLGLAFDKSVRFSSATGMRQALLEAMRATYGDAPSRSVLMPLASPDSRGPQRPPPPIETASRAPVALTPAQPAWTPSTPTRGAPRRAPWIVSGAVAAAVLAIGAGLVTRAHFARIPASPAVDSLSSATGPSPQTVPAESGQAPPSARPVPTESASTLSLSSDLPDGSAIQPAARTAKPARPPTAPSPPASVTRLRSATSCDPPYTIDSAGHRVPKPECL